MKSMNSTQSMTFVWIIRPKRQTALQKKMLSFKPKQTEFAMLFQVQVFKKVNESAAPNDWNNKNHSTFHFGWSGTDGIMLPLMVHLPITEFSQSKLIEFHMKKRRIIGNTNEH